MKKSFVLKTNITRIILNWACFYNWEDKDISESISRTLRHYEEMNGVVPDLTTSEVRQELKNYVKKCIDDNKYLQRELNKERKTYISPKAKNIKEFFTISQLPYKNSFEYMGFLKLAYQEL